MRVLLRLLLAEHQLVPQRFQTRMRAGYAYRHLTTSPANAQLTPPSNCSLSRSVVHPNIVTTYHYDVKAIMSMDLPNFPPSGTAGSLEVVQEQGGEKEGWKLYLVQVRQHGMRGQVPGGEKGSSWCSSIRCISRACVSAVRMGCPGCAGVVHTRFKPVLTPPAPCCAHSRTRTPAHRRSASRRYPQPCEAIYSSRLVTSRGSLSQAFLMTAWGCCWTLPPG